MELLLPLACLVVVQAASIEKNYPAFDIIDLPFLKAALNKYGFIKPNDYVNFKDIATSEETQKKLNSSFLRDIVDRPIILEFVSFDGITFSVGAQSGLQEENISHSFKSLLLNIFNSSIEAEIIKDPTYFEPDDDPKERGRLSARPRCGAFFYLYRNSTLGKQIETIPPYWVQTMIGKYGFKKPAYDAEFKRFAQSQGVSDPDVLGQIRDIYDQPVSFVYVDPASGVIFTTSLLSGFGEERFSPAARSLILKLIKTSVTDFGHKKEKASRRHKSLIHDKPPVIMSGKGLQPECEPLQSDTESKNLKVALFILDL